MLNSAYLANPARTGENRLPQRSLLIPAGEPGITWENVGRSDRVECLDGAWDFRYLPKDPCPAETDPAELPGDWDRLPVPSMWQYHGYGSVLYPNVQYPFPYDPPYIHAENPVGVYRRFFTPSRRAARVLLRFLGVDNAFFVYLNGTYVGMSKGSRLASEFDVTSLLRDGENRLTVRVYTYSDASYLENQDMLLASGIFRSVYLVYDDACALWDYTVLPTDEGFTVNTEMTLPADGAEGITLTLSLADRDGTPAASDTHPAAAHDTFVLPVSAPHLWNAEDPYLYTLTLTVLGGGEPVVHTKRVGLRTTGVEGCRLLLNGRPLTIKGVNRHDNDPHEGKAIDAARIRAELTEIKAANLNAIRTSHYTQQPVFYEIASELGLYVLDEADCESHGAHVSGDQGALNKDPAWYPAFFDRVSRMYAQDKNETCINVWSLGNECGGGECFVRCAAWLRDRAVRKPITCNGENVPTDFRETGYMTIRSLSSHAPEGAPVLMIEYGHAMGNSPGGLSDIWDYAYSHEQIAGGYVWEYKSHGFCEKGRDGQPRYLYGGDFGDVYHWSNFSLDGYHTSDGTAKPSWDELRAVSAPVWVSLDGDALLLRNTLDFTTQTDVSVVCALHDDDRPAGRITRPVGVLLPHGTARIPLEVPERGTGSLTMNVTVFSGDTTVGCRSFVLRGPLPHDEPAPTGARPAPTLTEAADGSLTVTGEGFSLTLDGGLLTAYRAGGQNLLASPLVPCFFRAPTDNDGIVGLFPRKLDLWAILPTMRYGETERHAQTHPESGTVTVTSRGKIMPQGLPWGFDTTFSYRVTPDGHVTVRMEGSPFGGVPGVLPRIGLCTSLPGGMDRVRWFGRGPGDSYPDRRENTHFGSFSSDVSHMNFLYDVPQETGSREDTITLTLGSGQGPSLTVDADPARPQRFAFSAHPWPLAALTAARHRDELSPDGLVHLYLDDRMRGLGSNSCGPEPEAAYELPSGPFDFTIRLSGTPGT